jgi:hypothetical protein
MTIFDAVLILGFLITREKPSVWDFFGMLIVVRLFNHFSAADPLDWMLGAAFLGAMLLLKLIRAIDTDSASKGEPESKGIIGT